MKRDEIQTLVERLLAALGAPFESVVVSEGARTVVSIASAHKELLIGPNGDHLRALNHIARRLAEKKIPEGDETGATFTLDVGGYLESQLEALRGNARMLAQRARLFKHEVELPPMTAYERLVIHELFADDAEIKTESAGEGKFRHVVLKYVEKQMS